MEIVILSYLLVMFVTMVTLGRTLDLEGFLPLETLAGALVAGALWPLTLFLLGMITLAKLLVEMW